MGGRGAYKPSGGFEYYEYERTGEIIEGVKVIRHKTSSKAPMPRFSNSPGAIYILQNKEGYKSIGIYGPDRRIRKEIEISHSHTNRYKSGRTEKLDLGVAHVHNIHGGRENNVRYMTKKEIKLYGSIITKIGGRTHA